MTTLGSAARACGLGMFCAFTIAAGTASAATSGTLACVSLNEAGDASDFSSACEVLDAANDDRGLVAGQSAFGISDWIFAGKDEFVRSEAGAVDVGFTLGSASGGETGSWSVDEDFWSRWSSALVLFKSGNTNQAEKVGSNGNVVMFLIQPDTVTGSYARSLGRYGVSHVSFYVAGELDTPPAEAAAPPAVPLPAALPLLGGALAGAGLVLRRRG